MAGVMASSWGRAKRAVWGGVNKKHPGRPSRPTYGGKYKIGSPFTRLWVHYEGLGKSTVARLVCEAFHGPSPFTRAITVNIDGNRFNNVPSNLKWATIQEFYATQEMREMISRRSEKFVKNRARKKMRKAA